MLQKIWDKSFAFNLGAGQFLRYKLRDGVIKQKLINEIIVTDDYLHIVFKNPRKLCVCSKCDNDVIGRFTFKWTKKKPKLYQVCDKCGNKELV